MTTRVYIDAVEFQSMRDTRRVVIRDGSVGCLLSSVLRKKGDTDDTQADIVLPDRLPDLLPDLLRTPKKGSAAASEESEESERERKAKAQPKIRKFKKKNGQSALRIC